MKLIPLSKGYFAIVDDDDYEFLMQWAWHVNDSGAHCYAMRNSEPDENGKRSHVMMHRVIDKTPEGFETDHRNGNGLDNRRHNLRTATRAQNMHNRLPNKKGRSAFKGVSWHKQHRKWIAAIQINNRRHHIGLFTSEADAAAAYQARAKREFGEFYREQGQ